ncbi:uncharacterized protein N7459_004220 [Penicillium hispanicum]|uniref:uncharacterized protein n=1 Tax=Penicillium hispanicum TaxID=1080232 RepID=UPI002541CE48|nr:uncharacterized protein N7459_004220 [Penicillium hispanicum]KAJ5584420.1 hypothetical protein N7459_004220 [Penicillium hispanicum]
MGRTRNDIPFGGYWRGKSVYKSPFRGAFIGPVHVVSRDAEPGVTTRRSTRARSPAEKPPRPRCEVHDQPRPSTPNGSDSSDSNAARKCTGRCCSVGRDPEPQQQVKRCQCSPNPRATGPIGPLHPGYLASTSTLTPVCHCRLDYWGGGLQSSASFRRDSLHDYHRLSPAYAVCAVHQPAEAPHNATPAKCTCKPMVSPPECDPRHHHCYRSDDYPSEPSSYATVSVADDTVSESSVDVGPGSDKGADECRCGHFVFAFPCGVFEVGYVAE